MAFIRFRLTCFDPQFSRVSTNSWATNKPNFVGLYLSKQCPNHLKCCTKNVECRSRKIFCAATKVWFQSQTAKNGQPSRSVTYCSWLTRPELCSCRPCPPMAVAAPSNYTAVSPSLALARTPFPAPLSSRAPYSPGRAAVPLDAPSPSKDAASLSLHHAALQAAAPCAALSNCELEFPCADSDHRHCSLP
jgi:hypothetical protein